MYSQAAVNYLYMAEELLEKAHEEASRSDDLVLKEKIYDLSHGIQDICEDIEEGQDPEYHPNYSVLPITDARYWMADQSHEYERLFEHKGRKFKVRIRRNAYDGQSWAHISGFDPNSLKWNVVAQVPFHHWPIKAQAINYVVPLTVEQQGALGNLANELCEIVRKLMMTGE